MLKSLALTEVRGRNGKYTFGKVTRLLGRNETGKSTIKEALCFAFAGTDSTGLRSPTHLISNGADGLRIEAESDKATISRTLTRKGSQSLSVVRNGVRTPCSQEQLSAALGCSPDLFLSIFLPGYFMTMPEDRRQAVLNAVLPPVDRLALLTKLVGAPLTDTDLMVLGELDRRPDRIVDTVARARRSALQQYSQIEGAVSVLQGQANLELPFVPAVEDGNRPRLAALRELRQAHADYNTRRLGWNVAKNNLDHVVAWNATVGQERAALESAIVREEAKRVLTPGRVDNSAEVQDLYKQMKPRPARPALLELPAGDRCPCCGQVVGSKHREMVQAEAKKAEDAYEAECAAVTRFNDDLQKRIKPLVDAALAATTAYEVAVVQNRNVDAAVKALRAKLKTYADKAVPELGPEPVPPTEQFDQEEERRLVDAIAANDKAVWAYEYAKKQREEAGYKLGAKRSELDPIKAGIERMQVLEKALAELPKAELSERAAQLTIHGYTFSLDGTTLARADGIPYKQLSTGACFKASIMLSWKLHTLMGPRSPGVMFVDDAELIDTTPQLNLQLFLAYVAPELTELVVEVEGG